MSSYRNRLPFANPAGTGVPEVGTRRWSEFRTNRRKILFCGLYPLYFASVLGYFELLFGIFCRIWTERWLRGKALRLAIKTRIYLIY